MINWKKSSKECLSQITALTVKEAIQSPSPAFGFINQDSPTHAKAILGLQVIDLVKSLNVGKTMDDFQVAKTVNMILEDETMRNLKPDDVKVCFERILKGHYGKNFDRIDTQTIFEALNLYMEERQLTVEEISLKRHELIKSEKMAPMDIDGQKKVVEILKSVINEKDLIKKEEPKPEVKKERVRPVKTERDHYIQNCFNEFFDLWKSNPYKTDGKIIGS